MIVIDNHHTWLVIWADFRGAQGWRREACLFIAVDKRQGYFDFGTLIHFRLYLECPAHLM